MKKKLFIPLSFIIAFFAILVSCPSNRMYLSIVGQDKVVQVNQGELLPPFTFDVYTSNDEFLSSAENSELSVKGLENFYNDANNANVKAIIKSIAKDEKDSSKYTRATIEVSGFKADKATDKALPINFEVPKVVSGTSTILKNERNVVPLGGRTIKINVNKNGTNTPGDSGDTDKPSMPGDSGSTASNVVSVKSSDDSLILTYCEKIKDPSITLVLTNAEWKDDISTVTFNSLPDGITVKSAEKVLNDRTLKVTFEGTPTRIFEKTYTLLITEDMLNFDANECKLPEKGLNVKLSIKVEDFTTLVIRPKYDVVYQLPRSGVSTGTFHQTNNIDFYFIPELPAHKVYFSNPSSVALPTLSFTPEIPLITDSTEGQNYDIYWYGYNDQHIGMGPTGEYVIRIWLITKLSGDRTPRKTSYAIDFTPLFDFPEGSNKKVVGEFDVEITTNVVYPSGH